MRCSPIQPSLTAPVNVSGDVMTTDAWDLEEESAGTVTVQCTCICPGTHGSTKDDLSIKDTYNPQSENPA
jgi:hypothetical protein